MPDGRISFGPDPGEVGNWEGGTLVIDTVGFNEKFWMTREGASHTRELHLVERITRINYYTLVYEVTVDDPGVYTDTWSGGWYLDWEEGGGERALLLPVPGKQQGPEHMIGPQLQAGAG